MKCNIQVYFNGAKLKKSKVIGIAYRIFKDDKLFYEDRNVLGGITPFPRTYLALREALKYVIEKQINGDIPNDCNIICIGDRLTLDNIQNGTYPKGMQKAVISGIEKNIIILKKSNNLRYKQMDALAAYCSTEINQYLSKVAQLSILESLVFCGKIKDVDKCLEVITLKKELGITNEIDFGIKPIKRIKQKKPIKNDFSGYNIKISSLCLRRWNERVSHVETKEEIIKYVLEASLMQGGIVHKYKSFYCLKRDIICVAKFNKTEVCLVTVYGAISKNPVLSNMPALKSITQKYGNLHLSLS